MHKHRLENEKFLDGMYQQFKEDLLNDIERKPLIFMDSAFLVKVLGGRIQLQETTTTREGFIRNVKNKAP